MQSWPSQNSNLKSSEPVHDLQLRDGENAKLFHKTERVNHEAGVLHNYQVALANLGNVDLHRCDHFTAISYCCEHLP